MTTPYGEDGERFTNTAFLVLVNRLVAIVVAGLLLRAERDPESFKPIAPMSSYVTIAVCNFMATFCQYEALKYLSFPTQTLGKCGKMIPVMLLGYFWHRKKYSAVDWGTMAAITFGSFIFLVSGDISPSYGAPNPYDTPLGLFLLIIYLFFDGFTSTSQERLFKGYNMSSSHQMFFVGACSALISVFLLLFPVDLLITTGHFELNHLSPAIEFSMRHPALIGDALILSMAATIGQALIYFCIKEFGALALSTIMVTRQFLSIFFSAIIFLHPITQPQWFSFFLVFGALYFRAFTAADKLSGSSGAKYPLSVPATPSSPLKHSSSNKGQLSAPPGSLEIPMEPMEPARLSLGALEEGGR